VAIATLTTIDNLLKDLYLPRVRGQFYKETPVYGRVMKRSEAEDFVGRKAIIAAHYGRPEGAVGARGENVTLPTAQSQQTEQMEVTMAYNYGSIKLTGQAISASNRNEGAFARALSMEMEGIRETMLFDMARQIVFGDGTGKLALTNGSGSSATSLIVDTPGVNHIRKGMIIDVIDSSDNVELNSIEVTAVVVSTNTLTVASSSWDDNSGVYKEDAKGKEMMGLSGIVDRVIN